MAGIVRRTGPLQTGYCQMEWLSYQSAGRGIFVNFHRILQSAAGLPDGLVGDTVTALLRRHEVLRTTFGADEHGEPRQCVHDAVRPTLVAIDDEPSGRRYVEMPFDLRTEPPVRFGRVPDGSLLLVVAHIAADQTAVDILENELTELLAAAAEGRAPRLTDGPPQPIDRALQERQDRARLTAALQHWDAALRADPVTVFPFRRGRPGSATVHADLRSRAADLALRIMHRRFAAPPPTVFIAAAYLALAIHYDRDDVALRLTWSSREFRGGRELVASVFRDMPLLVHLAGAPSFAEVLRRVRAAMLTASRYMAFDVLEFEESAGRREAERGMFQPSPEAINCMMAGFQAAPVRPDDDPRAALASSELSSWRSVDPLRDICALYISVVSEPGWQRISVAGDEASLGAAESVALARLIEAVLVAAADGDLGFTAARSLATDRWRPDGPGWARTDDGWVDVDALITLVRSHPAVREADLRVEGGALVAYALGDLDPWQLRDFVLAADNGRNALLSPHRFVIRDPAGGTRAGDGRDRPLVPPDGPAAQTLRDAVVKANGLGDLSMADTYLGAGGRLHLVPRVLALLADAGYTGLRAADLRRPASLGILAGRLRPASDRTGRDGPW